jgi:transposase-like protein
MNLVQVFERFPSQEDCIAHLEKVRWRGVPTCTYCGSDRLSVLAGERRYHCNNCKTSFSVTVGTVFHHTHLPLQKWFLAVALVLNAKTGPSSRQLGHDLQVNKNTGWRMLMQIRKAMERPNQRDLLSGMAEIDQAIQ